jgi:hypothetical protein
MSFHRLVFYTLFFSLCAVLSGEAQDKRPELPGGQYDKPYIRNMGKRVAVGGYIDMEFKWTEGVGNTFDQHRFIPFIYAEVTDRLHVSSEIEFEHGGKVPGDGEIKLEYATVDFAFTEAFKFRAGVILSPLGSFNLLHDSPLNDLTERPTVNRQIIPSTLSESGMGIFGTFYPSDKAVASYELYLVNGFNASVINSAGQLRIRSGRGSQKQDNNNDKALVGRFGFSPRLGMNFGASFHTGKYDVAGKKRLTILAIDTKLTRSIFEFQGEYARASANGIVGKQQGVYAQTNIHFLHDHFLPGSVFTGIARWDYVDYNTAVGGDAEQGLSMGLNFRPVEDAAFKLDYTTTWNTPANGNRSAGIGRVFFSVATYF